MDISLQHEDLEIRNFLGNQREIGGLNLMLPGLQFDIMNKVIKGPDAESGYDEFHKARKKRDSEYTMLPETLVDKYSIPMAHFAL